MVGVDLGRTFADAKAARQWKDFQQKQLDEAKRVLEEFGIPVLNPHDVIGAARSYLKSKAEPEGFSELKIVGGSGMIDVTLVNYPGGVPGDPSVMVVDYTREGASGAGIHSTDVLLSRDGKSAMCISSANVGIAHPSVLIKDIKWVEKSGDVAKNYIMCGRKLGITRMTISRLSPLPDETEGRRGHPRYLKVVK